MKNSLRSANDVILDIYGVHKKYNIDRYYRDLKNTIVSRCRDDRTRNTINEILSSVDNKNAPELHSTLVDQISIFDPEDQVDIIDDIETLSKQYRYEEYCKSVLSMKRTFMEARSGYFWNKFVCAQIIERTPPEVSLNPKTFRDQILSLWIDLSLKKIYPKVITVTYEDLNGKIITVNAKHHEPKLTEEYIESRLIDRNIGIGFLDSFYVHGLYDDLTNAQVAVPVSLIIDMYSDAIEELGKPDDEGKDEPV